MKNEIILDPIDIDSMYVDAVEAYLGDFFKKKIYQPLMSILKENVSESKITNSMDDLLRAIQSGRVSFYRGEFKGKFSAKITKELKKIGAVWTSKNGGAFKLPSSKLPKEVDLAIKTSEVSWLKTVDKFNSKIVEILGNDIAKEIDLSSIVSKSMHSLDADFKKSLKDLRVVPALTEKNVKDIAENYTENIKLDIKNFTENEIVKLRKNVEKATLKGRRYDGLASEIMKSYSVSQSKANFLARQETNLLVAKFKESRYNEIGCDEYFWQTVIGSPAHPVRESHKRLNGTRQKFSNPPVVNEKGERKNPQEDYGCRCLARPILKF